MWELPAVCITRRRRCYKLLHAAFSCITHTFFLSLSLSLIKLAYRNWVQFKLNQVSSFSNQEVRRLNDCWITDLFKETLFSLQNGPFPAGDSALVQEQLRDVSPVGLIFVFSATWQTFILPSVWIYNIFLSWNIDLFNNIVFLLKVFNLNIPIAIF